MKNCYSVTGLLTAIATIDRVVGVASAPPLSVSWRYLELSSSIEMT